MADEVHEQNGVAHDDAGQRDEADHRGRGERRAEQPVAEHDADEGEGDRRQNHERQLERAELGDDEDVDAEDRHHEGRAHVAEGDPGHLPFAVPKQRRVPLVVGLAVQGDRGLRQVAPVGFGDGVGHREHAVDRRLERAGQLRRDHLGGAAVVPEDRIGRALAAHRDDIAKLDDGTVARQRVGRHRRRQRALVDDALALGHRDADRDRLAAAAAERVADRRAGAERADRIVHVALFDAVIFEVVLIDGEPHPFRPVAEAVLDIDDERHALERLAHLGGDRAPRVGIGAVDFGKQRAEHRRPRRRLDHLHHGPGGQRHLLEPRAQVERHVVAGAAALALGHEVDRDVALFRLRT